MHVHSPSLLSSLSPPRLSSTAPLSRIGSQARAADNRPSASPGPRHQQSRMCRQPRHRFAGQHLHLKKIGTTLMIQPAVYWRTVAVRRTRCEIEQTLRAAGLPVPTRTNKAGQGTKADVAHVSSPTAKGTFRSRKSSARVGPTQTTATLAPASLAARARRKAEYTCSKETEDCGAVFVQILLRGNSLVTLQVAQLLTSVQRTTGPTTGLVTMRLLPTTSSPSDSAASCNALCRGMADRESCPTHSDFRRCVTDRHAQLQIMSADAAVRESHGVDSGSAQIRCSAAFRAWRAPSPLGPRLGKAVAEEHDVGLWQRTATTQRSCSTDEINEIECSLSGTVRR